MARSATETAEILAALYDESFRGEESERYRIGWSELRSIAGMKRLMSNYLDEINTALLDAGYLLITCDNYFVIAGETDFTRDRLLPLRLVERYLYDEEEDSGHLEDDMFEDDEIDDEENE